MDSDAIGAIAAAFGLLISAGSAGFIRMQGAINRREAYWRRELQKMESYWERRMEIVWRRSAVHERKLHELARQQGVSVNGGYEAELRALDREYSDLIRHGRG